jgi:hypothetical protein
VKRLDGPVCVMATLLFGAAAGGACGGQAMGEYDGAMTGVGPAGMAGLGGGGRGGSAGRGGRGGQGGTAMAGAPGRGGSATGGQGAGGSISTGGNAGVAGGSMGGASAAAGEGSCSSPVVLDIGAGAYLNRVERFTENVFDVCPGSGPEHVIRWTPPKSGRYLIDTFGSLFDTVLYASSDLSCSPSALNAQLECNDDFIPGEIIQSLLRVQAVGGRDMLIVVDSYNSTGGDFALNIRGEVECPIMDLGEQLGFGVYSTFEFAIDARVLPTEQTTVCRGGELGISFAWRAPATGVYLFATGGSGFPAVIALRQGCGGDYVDCDTEVDVNNASEVTTSLVQGEEIVIEVTAVELQPLTSFGQFVLSIQPL